MKKTDKPEPWDHFISHIADMQRANFSDARKSYRYTNSRAADRYRLEESYLNCSFNAGLLEMAFHFVTEGLAQNIITKQDVNQYTKQAATLRPADVLRYADVHDLLIQPEERGNMRQVLRKNLGYNMVAMSARFATVKHERRDKAEQHQRWLSSMALTDSLIDAAYVNERITPQFEHSVTCMTSDALFTYNYHVQKSQHQYRAAPGIIKTAFEPVEDIFMHNKMTCDTQKNIPDTRHLADYLYLTYTKPDLYGKRPSLN